MKRNIIERSIPGMGDLNSTQLSDAATTSNDALSKLAPKVQSQDSYVTKDKSFCVYLADSESDLREHARPSGFRATVITEVTSIIDPTTARA
ncbi:nickel-binding protein [Roseisalinus antarcticus]|uniref:DUF4242 domain-containing protein n=1 Tax=Roseisalinus antarcticus TaxID=254357 RepID=A0A1Y5TXD5_9RHOB|nr:nickel-binding protein [Roseisalinus antarcticus]SLN76069.1 hypothetical protein ROA7023_04098 [Roseisalinus antarcticus]